MEITNRFISLIMAISAFFTSLITDFDNTIADFRDSLFPPSILTDFGEKSSDAIRIMSFNIRFGDLGNLSAEDRFDDVETVIEKGHPDSIGLQEATPEWMGYLTENLEEYTYVGVGRDDGVNTGEYAAIFYLKDKYTAIDSGTFWLSDTPDVPSKGWGADCYRICTWVILENNETKETYVHMNSHFDFANEDVKYNSAKMINEKAKEFVGMPVVFTADMNFSEDSVYYNSFVDEGVFLNTKDVAEDTMDYLTYHDRMPLTHTDSVIDYIMINDKFDAEVYRVVTAATEGHYASDHFPLYADITLK